MDAFTKPLYDLAEAHGQEHIFRFWKILNEESRQNLASSVAQIDFDLLDRLISQWVLHEPPKEEFDVILPIPIIPPARIESPEARHTFEVGEDILRAGRVGAFMVAGGQGTRLGYEGPKGAYPIGPITGKSLFQYHAEKIINIQNRYQVTFPWYIMVSPANEGATRSFFEQHEYWGLAKENVLFFSQRMVPCVDTHGKLILESLDKIAMSPNGHGGCIQALVESGALADANARGIDILSYFQVDNWAVKIADPFFIGYHYLRNALMSSKCHRRNDPREAVGVHCLCDGIYRVIEYSELDLYPQLLESDAEGNPVHFAGNPAIHLIAPAFVHQLYDHFDTFPWHRAFKKIPYIKDDGTLCKPTAPNGYKFELFVFDALRFIPHPPVALEIERGGEYTPIKQFDGVNSVVAARVEMAQYWAAWLEAAGYRLPRDNNGVCNVPLEISPAYALTQEEFVSKTPPNKPYQFDAGVAIHVDGSWQFGKPY